MEAEPVQYLWRRYEERLEPSSAALAQFLGAASQDLVFVTNATTGVNAVVRSLDLNPGDELLTTSHDYNACHNVLAAAAERAGARLVTAQVPFPVREPAEVIEAVLRSVSPRTRLAMIDHATSNTGLVFPVSQIVAELQQRGVDTLVDGAHAPGMLPLNLRRLNPAYYTGNLHKWVCAPKGAAFLWAREDKQRDLEPAVISHGNNTPRPGYTHFQNKFDWPGTFDPSAWFCVRAALDFMGKLLPGGWQELRNRNHDLTVAARRLLSRKLEVDLPCPDSMVGSMATIALPARFQGKAKTTKIDPEQAALYDRFKIEVPFVRAGHPERRYFRISVQLYNTLDDFEKLAKAIARL